MFADWLDKTFVITRTSTINDSTTHIAKKVTQTLGPFKCRIGRVRGNLVQGTAQEISTQTLRLYTLIDTDIKAGDIVTIDTAKYTVSNVYKPANHHIETDITYKQEV